jgi:hypothetical protein
MPWICWWRKPRTPSDRDASLPGGTREQITLRIEACDSSPETKSARGSVLPFASAETRRERFFRHRRSASAQLLALRFGRARSSEPVIKGQMPPPVGEPLLLESGPPRLDWLAQGRAAYFKRGGYAVEEPQGMRLRAPVLALSAARLRCTAGHATKSLLQAGLDCGLSEKSGTDE